MTEEVCCSDKKGGMKIRPPIHSSARHHHNNQSSPSRVIVKHENEKYQTWVIVSVSNLYMYVYPYIDEPITWMDELQVHNPNFDVDDDGVYK